MTPTIAVPEFTRQTMFRLLVKALSYPGRRVDGSALPCSLPFHILDATLVATDRFHVAEGVADRGEIERVLRRRVGAVPGPAETSACVAVPASDLRRVLPALRRGSLPYPDEGATVVVDVDAIAEGALTDALRLRLSGPGVADHRDCWVRGLAAADVALFQEVNGAFPLGVDTILVDRAGGLLGIPRTTRVESAGGV